MKVLVIGGGIGGLTLARALLPRGHQVQVFERAEHLRTTGSALTLWSNGVGILDDLGVDLDGVSSAIDTIEQRAYDGRPMMRIDLAPATREYGRPQLCVRRRGLAERLAHGLPEDVISFGRACTGVTLDGAGVRAEFADGSTGRGDVLVGADGHRSVVRRAVSTDAEPRPAGWATWQGLVATPPGVDIGPTDLMHVGPEGLSGMFPAGDGVLQWWFDHPWRPGDPAPASVSADLRRRFGHWAEPVPRVLDVIRDDEVNFFGHYRHRIRRVWGRGSCTLLGDAAHLMPPTTGQGANQTLEDAWLLARSLDSGTDVPSALRLYERRRTPKVGVVSWLAGTETTNRYQPRLTRLLPDRLVTAMYTRWLGQVSDYLG